MGKNTDAKIDQRLQYRRRDGIDVDQGPAKIAERMVLRD